MANYCVSIELSPSCCSRNYLESVCDIHAKMFRGRRYEFVWSEFYNSAMLRCNAVCIGIVDKGSLSIYPQFKAIIPTESYLRSIIALFNLYSL